jgi:hypothetical protein
LSTNKTEYNGGVDSKAVEKVVDQLLKEKPFLKASSGNNNLGGGSNPGGGGTPDTVDIAKKKAEERNKGPQVTGGYDPWAKK